MSYKYKRLTVETIIDSFINHMCDILIDRESIRRGYIVAIISEIKL